MMSFASTIVLMLKGDVAGGSICDSACGRTITNVLVAVSALNSAYGGGIFYFNGVSAYLTLAHATDMDLVSDFTIDCRFRPAAGTTSMTQMRIFGKAANNSNRVHLIVDSNTISLYGVSAGTPYYSLTVTTSWVMNQIYHLAVTKSGSFIRAFRDGVKVGSAAINAEGSNLIASVYIGQRGDITGNFLFGWLEELRVTKGVALWTEDFVPPEGPIVETVYTAPPEGLNSHVVWYLRGDGADGASVFIDHGYNGRTNTTGGAVANLTTTSAIAGKRGQACIRASGVLATNIMYISTPIGSKFEMQSEFTIDGRYLYSALPGAASIAVFVFGVFASNLDRWNAQMIVTPGNQQEARIQFGASHMAWASVAGISIHSWNHFAWVRDSVGGMRFFYNGVSCTVNYSGTMSAATALQVAGSAVAVVHLFDRGDSANTIAGILCVEEFRVVKGVAMWTENFTPPTEPYTAELAPATISLNASNVQPLWVNNQGLQIANRFRYDAVRKIPDMSAAQVRAILMSAGYTYDPDNDHDFTSVATHSIASVRLYPTITEDDTSDVASIYLSDIPWSGPASTVGIMLAVAKDFESTTYNSKFALLVHGEGSDGGSAFLNSASNTVTITAMGGAMTAASAVKWGTTGMAFLAGSDGLSIPANFTSLRLSQNDFTIHFWALMIQSTGQWSITAQRYFGQYINESNRWHVNINSNAYTCYFYSVGTLVVISTSYALPSWGSTVYHHFCTTRNGTLVRNYVDGSLVGSGTVTGDWFGQSTAWYFARYDGTSQWFRGYMDEFVLAMSTVLWTSTFTPPTSAELQSIYFNGETIIGFLSVAETIPTGETMTAKGVSLRLT